MANAKQKEEKRFLEVLRRYSATYATELKAQRARLDELLGADHWLSVGSYKEALLRRILRERAPKFCEVGTGFLLAQLDGKKLMSDQVDVLIWDAEKHVPVFRDGEFVIIPPEACLAAIEVKGALGSDDLNDALRNLERITTFARFVNEFRLYRPPFRAVFAFTKKNREKDEQGQDKEKNYVSWPGTVFNCLWRHHQTGDASHAWVLSERLKHSRQDFSGAFELPWIDMVCILDVGFVALQEWSINGVKTPTYGAFDANATADQTFSAMHNELTVRLLAPEGFWVRDRPGFASMLLSEGDKRSTPAFMPLEKPPTTITSIGSLGKEAVEALASAWHRPRGATDWPRRPAAAAAEAEAEAGDDE